MCASSCGTATRCFGPVRGFTEPLVFWFSSGKYVGKKKSLKQGGFWLRRVLVCLESRQLGSLVRSITMILFQVVILAFSSGSAFDRFSRLAAGTFYGGRGSSHRLESGQHSSGCYLCARILLPLFHPDQLEAQTRVLASTVPRVLRSGRKLRYQLGEILSALRAATIVACIFAWES